NLLSRRLLGGCHLLSISLPPAATKPVEKCYGYLFLFSSSEMGKAFPSSNCLASTRRTAAIFRASTCFGTIASSLSFSFSTTLTSLKILFLSEALSAWLRLSGSKFLLAFGAEHMREVASQQFIWRNRVAAGKHGSAKPIQPADASRTRVSGRKPCEDWESSQESFFSSLSWRWQSLRRLSMSTSTAGPSSRNWRSGWVAQCCWVTWVLAFSRRGFGCRTSPSLTIPASVLTRHS